MAAAPRLWVGTVVIDCRRFDEMLAFWKAALGYEQRGPRDPSWTRIDHPHHLGPNLAFREDPGSPGSFWWFHLDLFAADPEREVARLVGLGARVEEPARPDRDFVTLLDPDGNRFDVITEPRRYPSGAPRAAVRTGPTRKSRRPTSRRVASRPRPKSS